MQIRKKSVVISAGLLTYIVAKFILEKVGIKNMPTPIIISLLVISYFLMVGGANKTKSTIKENKHLIICSSLLAVAVVSLITGIILKQYLLAQREISLVMAVISITSFIGAIAVASIIKKD